MFCHKLLPTWLVCVTCSLTQKSCWICFQLLCVSHCSRGSFYYRLNTWDDKFTRIRTDTCCNRIICFLCVHIFTHKYTFALICIETHRGLEIEGWERNIVMLPRGSTVSLVMVITYYLFLLLHMTRLFTLSLSFLHSHLGCLFFPMLNQPLQKQQEERLILNMLKSQKKPTWNGKLNTYHQKRLSLASCKYARRG